MALSKIKAGGIDNIAAALEAASDSNKFTDADHSKLNAIEASATADQTAAQIKTALENGIDSVHYVNGSIDTEHIGDDQVTADKLANSINSAIAANTSKTGISSAQTNAITANTAKTGITSSQATAITAALPKAGGTLTGDISMGANEINTNNNINFADNGKARFGTGNDLQIFHDGSHSFIKDVGTGNLYLEADSKINLRTPSGEDYFVGNANGSVELFHDNAKKIETTAAGVTVTGDLASDNFQVKATAPGSPSQGDVWFNSSASTVSSIASKSLAVYSGTAWNGLKTDFSATGGTITTSGLYTIHTFTSSGTFTPNKPYTVDYLVVAGGGGSGGYGGGGGAGGFRTATGFAVAATGLTVTVGGGGAGSDYNGLVASNGGNSVFSSITSLGGGGGSSRNHTGANGGSGGGGNGGYGSAGGSGTSGQGNNGGTAAGNQAYHGAGGGGASQTGGNGTTSCGNGGAGTASSYSGSSVTYAGGGGGATDTSDNGGAGGAGGGGKGRGGDGAATAGSANTGGGGGAGSHVVDGSSAGGSGIVIIRYLT